MTGMITTRSGTFLFRDDHGYEAAIWAWNIHDDPGPGGRVATHKWQKMPKGAIVLFDADSPPQTVPYLPILE